MASPRGTQAEVLHDTATLRRALESDPVSSSTQTAEKPSLVVLSGLPGTGKSHFASQLLKLLSFVVIGSDRSRKTLVSRPKYTKGEHARVFAACHNLIEELLAEGRRVVFDATNLTERFRQPLYDMAAKSGAVLVVVWFTASPDLVRRRLDDRAAGRSESGYSDADWSVYCRLRPGEESVAGPHLMVDSSQDIFPVLQEVIRRVDH